MDTERPAVFDTYEAKDGSLAKKLSTKEVIPAVNTIQTEVGTIRHAYWNESKPSEFQTWETLKQSVPKDELSLTKKLSTKEITQGERKPFGKIIKYTDYEVYPEKGKGTLSARGINLTKPNYEPLSASIMSDGVKTVYSLHGSNDILRIVDEPSHVMSTIDPMGTGVSTENIPPRNHITLLDNLRSLYNIVNNKFVKFY